MRGHLLALVCLLLAWPAVSAAQPLARHVLILHSFDAEYALDIPFARALRAELARQFREPISFFEASIQPAPTRAALGEAAVSDYQPGVWDQYKYYIGGTVVLVALQSALIAAFVVQRVRWRRADRALRESEQRYRAAAEQNQDLAGRLIDAQEAERSRIARDLHDDVSQQVASLGIMLSALKRRLAPERGPDAEAVAALQQRTSTLTDTIRNLSHELHPSVLQHAGLAAALRRHCADVGELHRLAVHVDAEQGIDTQLRPDAALCLFRVAQEAIANAVRHAQANTIRVRMRAAEQGIELTVGDNGVGLTADARTGRVQGLGLRSMSERVRLVQGQMTVESSRGRGTTLRVLIPHAKPFTRIGRSRVTGPDAPDLKAEPAEMPRPT